MQQSLAIPISKPDSQGVLESELRQ